MSNGKSILLLLVAVVVLVFANIAVRDRVAVSGGIPRMTLIDDSKPFVRLSLERRGGTSVVLEHVDEWMIVEPFAGSVDESVVKRLLDLLAYTPAVDVISDHDLMKLGKGRSDFSLEDPIVKITVGFAGDSTSISFGTPTPAADGVYAAVSGRNAVFVVPPEVFAAVDMDAAGFRRRSIFNGDVGSVVSFDIKQGAGSKLSFVRDGAGWVCDGTRAALSKVDDFLGSLVSASAVGFVWPVGASNEMIQASSSLLSSYGLDAESAVTVSVRRQMSVDSRISFGKIAGDGLVYASVQNDGAIVTVPEKLKELALQDALLFTDKRIFPMQRGSVSHFSIVDGDVSYVVVRDSNTGWRLESPIAAPADAAVVERILDRILSLTTESASVSPMTVSVSMSTNSAPFKVAKSEISGTDRLESLRSCELLRIEPDAVKRIVSTSAAGNSVSVLYDRGRKLWKVESEQSDAAVKEAAVAGVLAQINPLLAIKVEMLKVAASDLDDYGLDHPYLTLAIDQDREGAVRRNVLIGGVAPGGRFATIGSSDAVFVISDATVSVLAAEIVGK